MDGPRTAEPIVLAELVDPSRWQRLQDHFARVLGVPIRTIDRSHTLVVAPSWPIGLDADRAVALLKIGEELEELVPDIDPPRDASSLTTPLGVTYAVVPIRATADQVVAYFVIGPMMVGSREDEVQFRQRLAAQGIDARPLWPLLLSLKLYTFAGIRSALNLVEDVGASIAQLAYQAKQLSVILPATSKVDQAVVAYYSERILRSLLDAATLATKADGGSVMLFDQQGERLRIKVAHGLSDAVISSTQVGKGEGIAGFAAGQRSILVIDRETTNGSLAGRLTRPELVSSIVAPLVTDADQEPIGVLNLRTANPQRRFTAEHVELLKRLLELAGAALASLRFAFSSSRTTIPA